MVQEESRVSMYQDYMTAGMKILAEAYVKCHGGDLHLPSFIEMTHEVERQQTAAEIIEHIRKRLEE